MTTRIYVPLKSLNKKLSQLKPLWLYITGFLLWDDDIAALHFLFVAIAAHHGLTGIP